MFAFTGNSLWLQEGKKGWHQRDTFGVSSDHIYKVSNSLAFHSNECAGIQHLNWFVLIENSIVFSFHSCSALKLWWRNVMPMKEWLLAAILLRRESMRIFSKLTITLIFRYTILFLVWLSCVATSLQGRLMHFEFVEPHMIIVREFLWMQKLSKWYFFPCLACPEPQSTTHAEKEIHIVQLLFST